MTAQVLIITKECIVCSSDQAATMSDGKTYDDMRKIFKYAYERELIVSNYFKLADIPAKYPVEKAIFKL